jgi:hypothetical protein
MPVQKVRELHGLQDVPVVRRQYTGFHDEPLTEERKEQNRTWKRNANLGKELNSIQLKLCHLLDDKIFVAESLNYVASRTTGIRVQSARSKLEHTETGEGLAWSEKIRIAKTRLRDANLGYQNDLETLQMLNRFLIDRTIGRPRDYPELDTPEYLYRAFKGGCRGRHSAELGFRSSNQPLTPPSYHHGTLVDSSLVDKDALRNQCEGSQPSDLIALSDSPSRVLKIIRRWDYRDRAGDMIAVINVSKLLAMGVLFNRTTTLAKSLGMKLWAECKPTGLQFANPNYWVAYRWIPAECIELYISEPFLREACDSRGIGE